MARLALLHEAEQVGDQVGPFAGTVKLEIAIADARKKGTDKKLRLIKALGGESALLQFFENNSGE
ncbi:hypothetical protein [Dyella sp. RRB7]|uniref:hypothetical protein n=1 Tax=Dyella sp. RRB7 TaxID=2919502 RepID=UPI0031B825FE